VEHQEKESKRILLTNSQRMRVAAKAKQLSPKMPEQCTELFTPGTIMRWYQRSIAEKYDGSQKGMYAGRPPILQEVVDLVIRFKQENPRWGFKKIRDQVVCLGYTSGKHLEYVIEQYCEYYHHERIHQGVGRIIEPKHSIDERAEIARIERLGGLLKSYHRLAA
jgi:hypothetical protein